MLVLEMIIVLLIVHFNSCLTTKIEVSRGIGVIDNIWFPNAHLCPVRPRVLDTCSLFYRAIHIWGVWAPLSQSLIPSYFLGPQSSLGLYYYPVLMPCFTALFTIVRGTAHCTVLEAGCFRGIDSPRLGICCRLQPSTHTLSPSRS